MTPSIMYQVSLNVSPHEKMLAKVGLIALIVSAISIAINVAFFEVLYGLALTPIGVLFFVLGLGILIKYFEAKNIGASFTEFWSSKSQAYKLFLWYSAIFLSVWLIGVILFTLLSVAQTVYYVFFY